MHKNSQSNQAVIYTRFSREDDYAVRTEVQREICERLVIGRDLRIVAHLDDEGSGLDSERPNYQKLIKIVALGDLRYVVVQDTDRLTRDVGDCSELLDLFEDYNICIVSPAGEFDCGTKHFVT